MKQLGSSTVSSMGNWTWHFFCSDKLILIG